ncbi:unnamed protein product, partial [Oppiella nova]
MNVSLNPYHRQSGPTGSVHRISGAGISSSGESMMASNSCASDQKKWGDTTSRSGEISRIFVAPIDYKSASCPEIVLGDFPLFYVIGVRRVGVNGILICHLIEDLNVSYKEQRFGNYGNIR